MVIQIKNPNVLEVTEFKTLLQRALVHFPWDESELTHELPNIIQNAQYGVLVEEENGHLVGLSIISLPQSPLDTTPQVIMLYNEGTLQAKDNLIKGTVDFIHSTGYNRFWAINYSGRSDTAWSKVMKPEDWDISPIGSIMEFRRNG